MTWKLFVSNLPMAAAIAAVIGLIVCIVIIVKYKKKCKSATYPLSEFTNLDLTGRTDLYIGKSVSRRRIRTEKRD